jgi:5,10-methylenetetrahydrofolate reductase
MKLKELFDQGTFVVTSEIGPPKGWQVDKLMHETESLKGKVHAINVTDNQSSVMRLSPLVVSKLVKDHGMEPVYQITCRDRNRLALQSDILGAATFGIENLLLLTGDHNKLGDHPDSKPVFDLVSVSLTYTVKRLEQGLDLAGNKLDGEPPKYCLGAVVSPCSDNLDSQLMKMDRKIKAGIQFFQTQAVYETDKFAKFMEKAKGMGVPVMVGIVVLKTVGMARYMNENVAGVFVPDNLIEELKKDKEKTKSGQTGVEIAGRLIKEMKPLCQGVHLMPLGWDDKVPAILSQGGIV